MNLAKSLHTITVYERLIKFALTLNAKPDDAVFLAKAILGHTEMTDTYGLVDKALAKAQA